MQALVNLLWSWGAMKVNASSIMSLICKLHFIGTMPMFSWCYYQCSHGSHATVTIPLNVQWRTPTRASLHLPLLSLPRQNSSSVQVHVVLSTLKRRTNGLSILYQCGGPLHQLNLQMLTWGSHLFLQHQPLGTSEQESKCGSSGGGTKCLLCIVSKFVVCDAASIRREVRRVHNREWGIHLHTQEWGEYTAS